MNFIPINPPIVAQPNVPSAGIAVALYPSDASYNFEIQRATSSGGAGATSIASDVPGTQQIFIDALGLDNVARWYRIRHMGLGDTPGPWTDWIGGVVPMILPANIVRPAAALPSFKTERSVSGTIGTLTLTVTDPQDRVTLVEMQSTTGGGSPPGWATIAGPSPYASTVTIASPESKIEYRVTAFDANGVSQIIQQEAIPFNPHALLVKITPVAATDIDEQFDVTVTDLTGGAAVTLSHTDLGSTVTRNGGGADPATFTGSTSGTTIRYTATRPDFATGKGKTQFLATAVGRIDGTDEIDIPEKLRDTIPLRVMQSQALYNTGTGQWQLWYRFFKRDSTGVETEESLAGTWLNFSTICTIIDTDTGSAATGVSIDQNILHHYTPGVDPGWLVQWTSSPSQSWSFTLLVGEGGITWTGARTSPTVGASINHVIPKANSAIAYPVKTGEVGVVTTAMIYGNIVRYGAVTTVGVPSATAINNAASSVDALGGGVLRVPAGKYTLDADLTIPRTVTIIGEGAEKTIFASDGVTQRHLNITGSTSTPGDAHRIEGVQFDKVSIVYGNTNSDVGRGCVLLNTEHVNSDKAVTYRYHCYNTSIIGCRFRLNTINVYYDFATVVSDSGAAMTISDTVLSECTNALYVNGSTTDGYHIYLTNVITDNSSQFLKTTSVATDGIISVKNISFELISDCFIENDGANVIIDGFMALSTTQNYWFWNKSGRIMLRNGRGAWLNNKFVRIDAGVVVFDQGSCIMNGPAWGVGSNPFAHASSSGGAVVGPKSPYVGRINNPSVGSPITLTNASPTNSATRIAEAYDFNDRVIEFDFVSSAIGTDNSLRLQLSDGVSSPFVDLIFPVAAGGGTVRLVWARGGEINASAVFAPSIAGNSAYAHASTSDTTTLSATKFLALQTIKSGATASTITISNLREIISGNGY